MLSVYTLEQSAKWDNIVRTFAQYDTYWLSGYVRAFQIHGDGEPLLFFYQDESVRGVNVVMRRDIAKSKHFAGKIPEQTYFDFSTPYGYGGWLMEGQNTAPLFCAYENWCINNHVVSEFVRFHPVIKNHLLVADSYAVTELGETVAMDLSSPDIIWENITSKNRNMIRKAQKNGVKIYRGSYPEIYETFRTIYNGTMDKDNADPYYYFDKSFYDSILNDLSQNSQVFYAIFEEKIIAASIMLAANGKMNYHLSGSVREYASLAPSNLLLYEAALWGSANGYRSLYLGGGVGSCEDSLFKFKRAFYRGDNLNRFCIGKKILDAEKYEELVALRDDLEENGFFPKYRA